MFSEIIIGDVCNRPAYFNKYEFCVEFATGECDILTVGPDLGLITANLLENAKALSGDEAYELLKGQVSLDWPVHLGTGCWSHIDSFQMFYYNFKGVKRHVILK